MVGLLGLGFPFQAFVVLVYCAVTLWSNSRMATTDLQIETLTSGNGPTPQKVQTVSVHYTGCFTARHLLKITNE